MAPLARVLLLAVLALACRGRRLPSVMLTRAAVDSMNAAFERSNEHWDQLADLNTMERMLGTIRPTQREFLGCLQGEVRGAMVRIDGWVPARDMKQLQLAVAGTCDAVPRLVGTWHTHPYRADVKNLPIKERHLSGQDLRTFGASGLAATLVMWDRESVDAAVHLRGHPVAHPVEVLVR